MAPIGTATIKVVPDLSEFEAALDAIPHGFVMTETTDVEYNEDGNVARTVRTVAITRDSAA